MNDIFVKILDNNDIKSEIEQIGFDKCYLDKAGAKYKFLTLKIFNLSSPAANILKQTCLSIGSDCAVHRDVITNKIDFSDAILTCTEAQAKSIVEKLSHQPFNLKSVGNQIENILNSNLVNLKIRNTLFDWAKRPYIMGILNVTPNSFSDGGKYFSKDLAIKKAFDLLEDGADIIDIGGESTKPFSEKVDVEEEQLRILPVIKELRKQNRDIIISVDTRNSDTAEKVLDLGADIINDVSFLEFDDNMLSVIKKYDVPYILMHTQGTPENMQVKPQYDNVVEDIYKSFLDKLTYLRNQNMNLSKIIIDVGIGFGKTKEQNYQLLKSIKDFTSFNQPILLGMSRKSFLPFDNEKDLDFASAVLGFYSLQKNVNILRVHNVKLHRKMLEMAERIGV